MLFATQGIIHIPLLSFSALLYYSLLFFPTWWNLELLTLVDSKVNSSLVDSSEYSSQSLGDSYMKVVSETGQSLGATSLFNLELNRLVDPGRIYVHWCKSVYCACTKKLGGNYIKSL